MGLLNFLKEIFSGSEAAFKRLTPELIKEKKKKLSPQGYAIWLRREITYYVAILIEVREKGDSVPQDWIDKIEMLKKELTELHY